MLERAAVLEQIEVQITGGGKRRKRYSALIVRFGGVRAKHDVILAEDDQRAR